ncbi:MAG: DUF86 domain-containing protein [Syntrophaceae bacterium]|nr:DUF86 domain-containing protein [Syntrophaceae bacterium]
MKIDIEKIQQYLSEIKARHREIEELLLKKSDPEILKEPWILKGLKYTLIEIAEAMANTLQHILAKDMGEPVVGYIETIIRAGETGILPESLSKKLRPFFDFRNSLIHRYWFISDQSLLALVRDNKNDFISFIETVEQYIKHRPTP